MVENIYLNKAKKKEYEKDFDLLLNYNQDFWQLDSGVKEFLIKTSLSNKLLNM